VKADVAIRYLEKRGCYGTAIEMLRAAKPDKSPLKYRGSSGVGKNRDDFGRIINELLDGMTMKRGSRAFGSSTTIFEGSCGLHISVRCIRRSISVAELWNAATSRRRPASGHPPVSKAYSVLQRVP